MNYFEYTRAFWDFAFENPSKIKPNHCALYLFIVEHCNRLGWKNEFGLPTTMAKDAIGIRSYTTYIQTLNELVDFGFIQMVERSKNQYSSNIVALLKYDKALVKALDKATVKHVSKQCESTHQSTDSIIRPNTIDNNTNIPTYMEFEIYAKEKEPSVKLSSLKFKYDAWVVNGWKNGNNKPIKNWKSALLQTLPYIDKEVKPFFNSPA